MLPDSSREAHRADIRGRKRCSRTFRRRRRPVMTDPRFPAAKKSSVDRRDFIRVCTMALAAVGMPYAAAAKVAKTIAAKKLKPSVIWLHFQECTGCTESLLRTSHPSVSELILDLVSD